MTAPNEPSPDADRSPDSEPVPDWDDEYIDRVSDRLMFNYDLEKDRTVEGITFPLYGKLTVHSQKHFLHPALSFAHHDSVEHLFVTRCDRVRSADLDRLVELGHALAESWITPSEEHYSTDFTFVVVTDAIPESIRERVTGFDDRTLLKYGYNGHYEINLAVVAPENDDLAASSGADVHKAFSLWDSIEREEPGLLQLLVRRFQL